MSGLPATIALVQINNSFSGQNYLPYSVACLQSYFQQHASDPARVRFLEPIYKRMPIHVIVDRIREADLVGFSAYAWNIRISLEAARRLKALRPEIRIIIGGPEVPDHCEPFLRANPQIDLAFHNESERSFLRYLEAFPAVDPVAIPGVSWIGVDGVFHRNPNGDRIRDLDEIPSPFLNGVLDTLIRNNPTENWIGLWETNRGCPFSCSFCDWGSATSAKVARFSIDRLLREADWFSDNKIGYVFVCDANFGILSRDLDIVRHVADNRARTGFPQGFSVQNTKNATERAFLTQKILSDAGLNKGVALSVQSLSLEVLKNIRRDNISLDVYLELQHRFARAGVETFSDMILGLPGETYDSFVAGIDQLLVSGQHNRIQFGNCVVVPNAEMGHADYRARFAIETVETGVVNIHGHLESMEDDVPERQELVVATYSLSRADWCRCRAVAWMTALLHFDKILQIPIIVMREVGGVAYRDIFERFMAVDGADFPLLAQVRDFFIAEAKAIQAGGYEYTHSPEWLDIFWPTDEYIFIQLTAEKKLEQFYQESGALLQRLAREAGCDERLGAALADALRLNLALVHQPFVVDDVEIELNHNMMDYYQGVLKGLQLPLEARPTRLRIERARRSYDHFQTWCREIVWWGNKKGAYLYGSTPLDG
ncbi:MAG: radical SAM protein [Magnetococcales bacterium]|nr:radical SAM protein [Magnetococcales bacterium]